MVEGIEIVWPKETMKSLDVLIFKDSCIKKKLIYFVYRNKYTRVGCPSAKKKEYARKSKKSL